MDVFAYLGAIRLPEPREIPAINEDDEEAVYPLSPRFMRLPFLQEDELELLPRAVQGPIQRLQPELVMASVPSDWPIYDNTFHLGVDEENQDWEVYENMEYLDVQEENQELLDAQQDEEEEQREAEPEEEILINKAVSQQGPVQVDHSTKHRMPMNNDKQLMKNISSSSAEPHIATIGIQELSMPDATLPVFVATLERADLQQARRQ